MVLERLHPNLEAVEVAPDGLEIFRAQRMGQRRAVTAQQQPLHVWVFARVEDRQGVLGPPQQVFGEVPLGIVEKARVTAATPHDSR